MVPVSTLSSDAAILNAIILDAACDVGWNKPRKQHRADGQPCIYRKSVSHSSELSSSGLLICLRGPVAHKNSTFYPTGGLTSHLFANVILLVRFPGPPTHSARTNTSAAGYRKPSWHHPKPATKTPLGDRGKRLSIRSRIPRRQPPQHPQNSIFCSFWGSIPPAPPLLPIGGPGSTKTDHPVARQSYAQSGHSAVRRQSFASSSLGPF